MKNKVILFLFLINSIIFSHIYQNNDSIKYSVKNENNFFYNYKNFSNFSNYYTKDFNLQNENFREYLLNKDYIKITLFLSAITKQLMLYDENFYHFTKNVITQSKPINSFFHKFVEVGDAKWHFGLSGLALMLGYAINDERLQNCMIQNIEAEISSGLFVQILKRISGRESPALHTKHGGRWKFLPKLKEYQRRQPKYYAFPSGHITTASTFFTVISENYPELKFLNFISYPVIGLLGISLVANDMHWFSDLPIGIVIGNTFGKLFSKNNNVNMETNLNHKNDFYLIPTISNKNYSITAVFSF